MEKCSKLLEKQKHVTELEFEDVKDPDDMLVHISHHGRTIFFAVTATTALFRSEEQPSVNHKPGPPESVSQPLHNQCQRRGSGKFESATPAALGSQLQHQLWPS